MCKRYRKHIDAQEVPKDRKRRVQTMTEQAAAARRAYKRNWAKNNREKVRAAQERYWEKIAERAEAEKERAAREED